MLRPPGERARLWLCGAWLVVLGWACTATSAGEAHAAPAKGSPSKTKPAAAAPSTPTVELAPAGRPVVRVRVEVVERPEDRQRGLMNRHLLDADAGMLFVFERAQPLTFWMRNTYIPLDMIFIGADKTIVGIVENAPPESDDPRSVPGVSQYVLEVNAGFSQRHGLAAGTKVRFLALGK